MEVSGLVRLMTYSDDEIAKIIKDSKNVYPDGFGYYLDEFEKIIRQLLTERNALRAALDNALLEWNNMDAEEGPYGEAPTTR